MPDGDHLKPRIRVVSVDTESEKFLVKKSAASSIENEIPEKNSSQTPYTSQKEADVYEKSLPTYEQTQTKVVGAAECLGVPSAPALLVSQGGCVQPVVQAKAEVHRASESDGDPASQREAMRFYGKSDGLHSQAPLASFQGEVDASSVESTASSPFLQRCKNAPLVPATESQLRFQLPCYEDFALIDSLMGESQGQSKNKAVAPTQGCCSIPAPARDGTSATDVRPGLLEIKGMQNVEEDDMYYGIKEGPQDIPTSVDAVFGSKD
ncbi:barttin [Hemicordylus capensis]|uniref:barttin n=1 Tax=Hemicordylus capensis TaxID=884348 RepID=UPI0023024A85|nr:barttin [Hemicordylus capensis]